ncbi:MAG TPA: 2Fe-2S iron-sulfur cluster-binding protein, partial [Variovorax sp.]|nr:2Fe-2S iron-sulfur cluster-binding protein [Variovorax sp.]
MVRLIVEGRSIEAPATSSILQAFVHAGETLVEGVGCMGQGVCGSCRVMVRRAGQQEVKTQLACETVV